MVHRRTSWIAGAAASFTLLAVMSGPVHASPKQALKPIGYIYAGTINEGLDTLAVAANHTMTLVKVSPAPAVHISGVAILHTKQGVHLYVLAGPFDDASIYEYSVNGATGDLTLDKVPPVTGLLADGAGNNLHAYDGFATNPKDASNIYVQKCVDKACTRWGLADYHSNPTTGALKLAGPVKASPIEWVSLQGDRMDLLEQTKTGDGILPIVIDHKSGDLRTGVFFDLVTNDNPALPTTADLIAAGPVSVGVGGIYVGNGVFTKQIAIYPSTGVHLEAGAGVDEVGGTGALAFIPHALLAGGYGATYGPELQLVSPSGVTGGGSIDLTRKPYDEGIGNSQDPNTVETIFALGIGIYIGNYAGLTVQGTDVKGLVLNKSHPTVAGTGSTTSMTGFLKPTATKTTLAVAHKGKALIFRGSVAGGVDGLAVSITLEVKHGSTYHPVQHKDAALTKTAHYSAGMSRPTAARCRAAAVYAGDAATAASRASLTFAC
jgi:hypothetical protein